MTEAEIGEIYASKIEEGAPIQKLQVSTRRQRRNFHSETQEKISHTNIFILAQ